MTALQVLSMAKDLHKMCHKNHQSDQELCLCWFYSTNSKQMHSFKMLVILFIEMFKKKVMLILTASLLSNLCRLLTIACGKFPPPTAIRCRFEIERHL